MAEHCNLYDRASYYDIIFNRDVSREVDFVGAAYARHVGQGEAQRVLDLACGPGYHARAFAARGIPATGLDLRAEMLRFAADQAKKDGLGTPTRPAPHWLTADMREFRLAEPVDAAFCMFDGLDCLTDNDDLIRHFRAVADNLTARGIYVVDLSHPAEVSYSHYKRFHYEGARDGVKVDIFWATNNPSYDLATGIAHVALEMHVDDNGKKFVVEDAAKERLFFPQELALLAKLSGALEVVAWYGDFDIDRPLDYSPKSRRMIAILQKVG